MSTNKAQFTIVYDGNALASNAMDVKDLAPALLAFADIFTEANRVLNGKKATINVSVRAFQKGSFGVELEVFQSISSYVVELLSEGSKVRDALELLGLLGFTVKDALGVGLVVLLQTMKGQKPQEIKPLKDGQAKIIFLDDAGKKQEIIVKQEVIKLYAELSLRDAMAKSLEPLRREGIDSLHVKHGDHQKELVSSADLESFASPELEPEALVEDADPIIRYFDIVSLSFKEDNKWRLSDGSNTMSVKMGDKEFLHLVHNGEVDFAKGDSLKVSLKTTQYYGKDGQLKTEYEAIKVLEHKKRQRQLYLPM